MKTEFIENLVCPACKNIDLAILKVDKEDQAEIREGTIQCRSCNNKYAIEDGILDLLLNHEIQTQYDPDGRKKLNCHFTTKGKRIYEEGEIANRENLDKKWVINSTANFDQIFNWVQLTGDENVMEVGAGTCWAIKRFAERGCKCVALDILKQHKLKMADYWFEEKNMYFERILADMNIMNFKNNTFDIVYSLSTLMYSSNIQNTLNEIERVLKPDGKMILIAEPVVPFYQGSGTFKLPGSGNAYTIFKWDQNIKKAGLKVIKRFFAESIKMRFKNPGMITQKNRWYYLAVKLLNPLWETKFLNGMAPDNFSWIYSVFMPLPLMIVAVKEK